MLFILYKELPQIAKKKEYTVTNSFDKQKD